MSCCYIVLSQQFCPFQKCIEFYEAVAVNTRIRCQSVDIGIVEFVYYTFPESVAEIIYIEWYIQPVRYAARVFNIVKAAAAAASVKLYIFVCEQSQCYSRDFILFFQYSCRR